MPLPPGGAGPDFQALFAAVPTACLVIDSDLRVVEVNAAYERTLALDRAGMVGRLAREVFSHDAAGWRAVEASWRRVFDTGVVDRLPLVRFDLETEPGSGDGRVDQRWWSAVNVPVRDDAGAVVLVLHAAADVTEVVLSRDRAGRERTELEELRLRTQVIEADISQHAGQLVAAAEAEARYTRRLAALAGAALALAAAETESDLCDVAFTRGLAALEASGGAVAVRQERGGDLRVTATASLGADAQRIYGRIALDGPLPGSVAARTGETVLLGDPAAGLAFHPQMAQVYADVRQRAWAVLPLRSGHRLLGSISVAYDQPQDFPQGERDLLAAFAAQCAQALDRMQVREAATETRRWSEALQRGSLTDPPPMAGLDVAVRYQPAAHESQIGGDWYDAFVTGSGTPTLVIGDVAGHDRAAAVEMAQVRGVLRGVALTLEHPPAAVLSTLDRALAALGRPDDLVAATAVVCQVLDAAGGPGGGAAGARCFAWSNAGHPPPLLISAAGAELLERPADLVLGVDVDTARGDHQVPLPAGAAVVLYTDGLVERRGESLQDGLARLVVAGSDLHGVDADRICDVLLDRLAGGSDDDIALLVVRVRPTP